MCKKLKKFASDKLDKSFSGWQSSEHCHGRHCTFIKINERIGIKVYQRERMAKYAYEKQSAASAVKAGPIAYCLFKWRDYWCYVTQIADTPYNWYGENDNYSDPNNGEGYQFDEWLEEYFSDDDVCELKERLESIGFRFTDCAPFNYGEINGKLVCIDFGKLT